VNIYKEEVIPKANVLLPNQTECEFLTGMTISNEKDAINAIDKLHNIGIQTVIIKSLTYQSGSIVILGSTRKQDDNGSKVYRFITEVPKIDFYFSGTGDLFAALFLGWISKGCDERTACEKTVNSLYAILVKTFTEKSKELRLVQSKSDIETPIIIFKVKELQ